MLSLWGKPATASNLSGAPQPGQGFLELCCCSQGCSFVVRGVCCSLCHAGHSESDMDRKRGWLCLCKQSWVSVPLPISMSSISSAFPSFPEQCSGWWWNVTQALKFYSPAEPTPFPSPKKPVQLLWKHLWLQPCQIVLIKHVFSEPDCQVS